MKEWNYTIILSNEQLIKLTNINILDIINKNNKNNELNIKILELELNKINKLVKEKSELLEYTGESIIGISILHEFILDILGRETSYGKIFIRKAEIDFKKLHIISKYTKIISCIIIIIINLFCLFYAILKGYSRGILWQKQFLFTSILQLLVEIILFESLTVIWNNIIIPQFAIKQVNNAYNEILLTINKFIDDINYTNNNSSLERKEDIIDVFNITDYYFISNKLSKIYNNNIESKIINRYESIHPIPSIYYQFYPLELKYYNNIDDNENENNNINYLNWIIIRIKYFITIFIVFTITSSIELPSLIQDLIINIIQPSILGGILYLIYLCYKYPLISIGIIIFILIIIYIIRFYLIKLSIKEINQIENIDISSVILNNNNNV